MLDRNLALDNLALDNLALDNLALDNLALDNLALDNLALDNLALDNLALDNLALDNLALDGNLAWRIISGNLGRELCPSRARDPNVSKSAAGRSPEGVPQEAKPIPNRRIQQHTKRQVSP